MSRKIKLSNKPIHRGQLAGTLPGKFWWVLLALLSVFLMASVLATPIIGFFLNHEQKQCNIGISGDEHGDWIPPYPWQKAEPDSSGIIQTKYGSCNLNEFNNNRLSPQDCCKQLGYTYVDKISGDWTLVPNPTAQLTPDTQPTSDTWSILAILFIIALAIFLVTK